MLGLKASPSRRRLSITIVVNAFEEFIKSLVTEDAVEDYQASLNE
ncbi:hypothetical protein [Wohlfahrtiimonas larvae]|uniref:Integrase n=1 Tax=Wohlfahrtiimonas larvae TaxID=1157986 RepID=A0ABP9MYR2_9GAMM|nr:hypothetical protein [Wohlfahrtiimonas larvae]